MINDALVIIQQRVRDARATLESPDQPQLATVDAMLLLRSAEQAAGDMPSELVVDAERFQAVLDVRNELGCCLLAAERLGEAGVESRVVVGILQRGATTVEEILGRLSVAARR